MLGVVLGARNAELGRARNNGAGILAREGVNEYKV